MKPKEKFGIFAQQDAAVQYSRMDIDILPLRQAKKLPVFAQWQLRATSDEQVIRFLWSIGSNHDLEEILEKINAPILERMCELPPDHREQERLEDSLMSIEQLLGYPNPRFNIGILTGEKNGITVLDQDVKEVWKSGLLVSGKTSWDEFGKTYGIDSLATSLRVRTPSGGTHYYYRHRSGVPNRAPLFQQCDLYGIDCRNDGGFVVAPPSKVEVAMEDGRVKSNFYRWMPIEDEGSITKEIPPIDFSTLPDLPEGVILQLAKESEEREVWRKVAAEDQSEVETLEEQEEGEYAPQSLDDCLKYLETFDHIVEGERNRYTLRTIYYIVGKFRLLSYDDQLEALEWWNENRCHPPQELHEFEPLLMRSIESRDREEEEGQEWIKPRRITSDRDESPLVRLRNRFAKGFTCRSIVVANRFLREEYPDLGELERAKLLEECRHESKNAARNQ